jgi:hypothetical protein
MNIRHFLFLPLLASAAAEPLTIRDTSETTSQTTDLTIVKGSVDLPRKGSWTARKLCDHQGGLTEIYLFNDDDPSANDGRRSAQLKDRAATQDRSGQIRSIYWNCRAFAEEGDGLAPNALIGLKNRYGRGEVSAKDAAGIHLMPGIRILKKVDDKMVRVDKAETLLIDLTPVIDDGKHWILDSQGRARREEIDSARMKALGLTVRPQAKSHLTRLGTARPTITYTVMARRTGAADTSTFTVDNITTKASLEVTWDTQDPAKGDQSLCSEWAKLRLDYLRPSLIADASAIPHWATTITDQYGLDNDYTLRDDNDNRRRPQRSASAMGVIGGRAAIRETLQLQNIAVDDKKSTVPSIPVDELAGVEVAAHPFEEMLGGKPGGSLPLADWIPQDHFFLYLPKPKKLFTLLDSSSAFLFKSGATLTGHSGSHQIKDRYLESFGVSEELMRRFLDTGAIKEAAATVPDLFFIDGTEISIVMRTGNPLLTTAALALIGVPPGDGATVKKNKHGESVHWVRQGNILIISTHQDEVDAILAAKKDGTGLGQSQELRYMLTQVPVTTETVAYTYLSDPFIRNLVGPATKIGQLRRLHARADLESASAAALLAKFDGREAKATDLAYLSTHEYLRPAHTATDRTLGTDLVSVSEIYGTPRRMHSLTREPVDLISPTEKDAYAEYLTNYNRFWRRFFDPIAIRYEQKPGGQHELETFILPLIENSLYSGIRQAVSSNDNPLPVPVIEPTPVAVLSVNLNDEAWVGMIEEFSDSLTETLGLDGSVLDLLGPDIHVALHDADPIISIGNGELAGMFSQFSGMGNSEMFGISTIISMLTRPCSVHIGLSDPAEVRRILTRSSWDNTRGGNIMDFADGSLAKITGKDKWIYRISIEGIITLRFGIEVQDRYLVINNLPFSNEVTVTGNAPASNGAVALRLNPGACVIQAPALYSSAAEANRSATKIGAACLLPMILAGNEDIDAAREQHARIFGFTPVHPGTGTWSWNADHSELVSSTYASLRTNHQPEFDPEDTDTGIFRKVSRADFAMQFEEDGLRTTVTWKTRK